MDWSNEHYVRIYTRDTTTWLRLGWDGQCVLMQMARKMDLAGVMDIDDLEPWEAVVMHCRAAEDVAKRGMGANLRLGVFEHRDGCLLMPNYIEAQEASKSDKQRQRESRDRRRDKARRTEVSQNVTGPNGNVTEPSHAVTDGHTRSLVTSAVQCVTDAVAVPRAREGDDDRDEVSRDTPTPDTPEPVTGTLATDPTAAEVARHWNVLAEAAGSVGHPLRHHRDDFGELAGFARRQLPGQLWRDFLAWWWGEDGWAGTHPHLARPASLVKSWDSSMREWQDPFEFARSRERGKQAPGESEGDRALAARQRREAIQDAKMTIDMSDNPKAVAAARRRLAELEAGHG